MLVQGWIGGIVSATKVINDFTRNIVSPQLTPSCNNNNNIDLRHLSKINYTHDEGNRNAKTL